jgi:hypothetical protein
LRAERALRPAFWAPYGRALQQLLTLLPRRYATVYLNEGKEGKVKETQVQQSSVVFADLFPVWNCDPLVFEKPPPPPAVSAIDQEEAKVNRGDQAYKDTTAAAVAAEKVRFRELRKEGKRCGQRSEASVKSSGGGGGGAGARRRGCRRGGARSCPSAAQAGRF